MADHAHVLGCMEMRRARIEIAEIMAPLTYSIINPEKDVFMELVDSIDRVNTPAPLTRTARDVMLDEYSKGAEKTENSR
jgi:hypothetical protein